MRSGIAGKSESSSKISFKMFYFLDVLNQFAINCLLNGFGFGSPFRFGIFSFLAFFVSSFRSILKLVLGEMSMSLEERVINIAGDSIN